MINTIVNGVPSNGFNDKDTYKFVVRTFFNSEEDMYVTDVYFLREEEHFKNINVTISADSKEDAIEGKRFSTRYPLSWICNHRARPRLDYLWSGVWDSSLRKLGEQHLKICKEIINGEYWLGEIAY
jgi:hypothetical protein